MQEIKDINKEVWVSGLNRVSAKDVRVTPPKVRILLPPQLKIEKSLFMFLLNGSENRDTSKIIGIVKIGSSNLSVPTQLLIISPLV